MNMKERPKERPQKLDLTIKVDEDFCIKTRSSNEEVSRDKLIEFLDDIKDVFDKVSVPVYCPRSILNNDITLKGEIIVGYINSYDPEDESFYVTIYPVHVKSIEAIDDIQISAGLLLNSNAEIKKITKIRLYH